MDEHCQLLDNVLQGCAVIDALIDQCKQAGLNVEKYANDNLRRKQLATGLKRSFFPNKP